MSCKSFQRGKFIYTFSNDRRNFSDSVSECNRQGGFLIKNIRQRTYVELNEACTSTNQYWIGLVNARKDCRKNNRKKKKTFRWFDAENCINTNPLRIGNIRGNQNRMGAVAITVNSRNQLIPLANLHNRDTQLQYICQFPFNKNSNLPPNSIFGNSSTTFEPTIELTTFFDEMSGSEETTFTPTNFNSETTTTSLNNEPVSAIPLTTAIVGGIAGLLLLLLLLVSFLFCKSKKGKSKTSKTFRLKSIFSRTRNENNEADHVYSTIPAYQIGTTAIQPTITTTPVDTETDPYLKPIAHHGSYLDLTAGADNQGKISSKPLPSTPVQTTLIINSTYVAGDDPTLENNDNTKDEKINDESKEKKPDETDVYLKPVN